MESPMNTDTAGRRSVLGEPGSQPIRHRNRAADDALRQTVPRGSIGVHLWFHFPVLHDEGVGLEEIFARLIPPGPEGGER
jgi:hypothetical protein